MIREDKEERFGTGNSKPNFDTKIEKRVYRRDNGMIQNP